MKNWLKILKFTLKQGIKSSKFITSTVIVGIVILIATTVSNILISGFFDDDSETSELKAVYIANETNLNLDTEGFISNHKDTYPSLTINEISGKSAEEAASDSELFGDSKDYSIILGIKEDDESCNMYIYIPADSIISESDAKDFAKDFSEDIKKAKIISAGATLENLDMAVSDIRITSVTASEFEETESYTIVTYLAPLAVMMILYLLVIIYGQSIGNTVSMEKTSKLMEYILTLSDPAGIIFGKVTAIFCEAVIQLATWGLCVVCGFVISGIFGGNLIENNKKNIIFLFMESLPEGAISSNFAVLLTLSVIALLAAFLFYCFVSALFASFAATAEELTQTNTMSVMTMLVGFMGAFYIPLVTDYSKLGMILIHIIPFTSAFTLPGNILSGKISLVEYILYMALLITFTVLLAMLTGRVYKNRLFKKGTKGIFAEILSAITGNAAIKADESSAKESALSDEEIVSRSISYENHDKAKKTYTIVGFALLTLILGGNAIGGLVGNVIANLMAVHGNTTLDAVYQNKTFLSISNIVAIYLIACPLCFLVLKLTDDSKITVKDHLTVFQCIRAMLIIFPVDIFLSHLSTLLASALTGGKASNSTIGGMLTGENVLTMIMVSVLAPIFEELVFRKLIIDRTRRYGEFTAILYSSLAFGLFHCNLYQIIYAFAIGIILGYVYIRTGNVVITIIMHMIVNSSAAVLYPMAPQLFTYFEYTMIGLGILSLIYTVIKRDVKLKPAQNEVSQKELSSLALFNTGSILFTVVCILISIYMLYVSTIA